MSANADAEKAQQLSDLERIRQMESARELDRIMRRIAILFSMTIIFSKYLGGFGMCFDHAGPTWY